MALKEPQSMEECVYYTNRDLDNGGFVRCWVFREFCPKCGKELMGKPKDPKTGKAKIRAAEYQCPECGYVVEKEEYEDTLTANVQYTCPHCSHKDEMQIPFKRKKVQRIDLETQKKKAVDAIVFACSKCGKKIEITKKMK
jgi:predicted RNA-binding Zn-ribbon protein involved in translation (DUF1610 family)